MKNDDLASSGSVSRAPESVRPGEVFASGFNNDYDPSVRRFLVFSPPGPPHEPVKLGERYTCKACERAQCTASAQWCSQFCCPGCASGEGHTTECNRIHADMLTRIVDCRSLIVGLYPYGVIIQADGTVTEYKPLLVGRDTPHEATMPTEAKS
jgi:hypothetical protein